MKNKRYVAQWSGFERFRTVFDMLITKIEIYNIAYQLIWDCNNLLIY